MPGMSASIDIKTNKVDNALTVPVQAVTTREATAMKDGAKKIGDDDREIEVTDAKSKADDKKKQFREVVFVVVGDTVAQRYVTTGIQDNSHIQILTGLAEGDEVVSGPYTVVSRKLKSGNKIDKEKLRKEKKTE